VGLGGVWVWAELAAGGSMDATVAFCGHGASGANGAFGHPDPLGEWTTIDSLADAPAGAFPFFDTSQTYDSYYVLDFFPGTGSDDFIAVVPASLGHFSVKPAPAVTIETQVAP
jgi:hypothetical protein